jgi:hypothetical protein
VVTDSEWNLFIAEHLLRLDSDPDEQTVLDRGHWLIGRRGRTLALSFPRPRCGEHPIECECCC